MSYCTLDKFGGISTTYAHSRGGGPPGGTGLRSWWPDFGPGCQDFSQMRRSHPSESIFESVVDPKHWSAEANRPAAQREALAEQFRNPAPARHAMLHKTEPEVGRKAAARITTIKQASLQRLEHRSKRVDSWLGSAPIRMSSAYLEDAAKKPGASRSLSEPSIGALSSAHSAYVSRDVYEKHGWLVGRSQGAIADGRSGQEARRHNPLSYHAMMFSGDLQDSKRSRKSSVRKPTGQWRASPDKNFVFDPKTGLPMPRGGWDSTTEPGGMPGASSRTNSASASASASDGNIVEF